MNNSQRNLNARLRAIKELGLSTDYQHYVESHDGLGKGITQNCLANQYCETRHIPWEKWLEEDE